MPVKMPVMINILYFCLTLTVSAGDFPLSRADGFGGAALISEPTASEIAELGLSLPDETKLLIDIGYKREYQLPELDNLYFAGAGRYKKITISGGVSQFGDPELYTEKNYLVGTGCDFKDKNYTALIYKRKVTEFNQLYPAVSTQSLAWSISIHFENLYFSWLIETDNNAGENSSFDFSSYDISFNTGIISSKIFYTAARISIENSGEKQFGIGQQIQLYPECSILFGYESNPRLIGGGIILTWAEKSISYTTAFHPVLGFTYTISLQIELLKKR